MWGEVLLFESSGAGLTAGNWSQAPLQSVPMKWILMGMMALILAACGGGGTGGNTPNAANVSPSNEAPASGLEFERVPFDELPTREPTYLWPSNGARLSSDRVWVIWKTAELVPARLLGTKDKRLWYELAVTAAKVHFAELPLDKFDSRAVFCVDYEEEGKRFRSALHEVRFGNGIRFAQRECKINIEAKPDQRATLAVENGDLGGLGQDDYLFALAPDNLRIYGLPHRDDAKSGTIELVIDGSTVPGKSCILFMEIRDPRTNTRDRTKLVISVK